MCRSRSAGVLVRSLKPAYEEFLERGKEAQAHRQTVAGWGQEWLERKEKSVKYRTYANYELYFNHYILPALGKMQLSKLHQADIERMMGNAAHLSKSARHHIFITIDQIMKSAVINGLCSRNPCDGIKIKPDTTFKHIEVYKPEELTHIIAHLDRPFGTAIAILLYTGIRSEEIMGLRWNDIDQKNRTITIRRVVTRVAKGEFAPWKRPRATVSVLSLTAISLPRICVPRLGRASMSCRPCAAAT